MKKGKKIGMNKRQGGVTGEKYISLEKGKFRVFLKYNGKYKNVGMFKNKEDAIICRDKFVDDFL